MSTFGSPDEGDQLVQALSEARASLHKLHGEIDSTRALRDQLRRETAELQASHRALEEEHAAMHRLHEVAQRAMYEEPAPPPPPAPTATPGTFVIDAAQLQRLVQALASGRVDDSERQQVASSGLAMQSLLLQLLDSLPQRQVSVQMRRTVQKQVVEEADDDESDDEEEEPEPCAHYPTAATIDIDQLRSMVAQPWF
jgi:uncharacterized protein YhaN